MSEGEDFKVQMRAVFDCLAPDYDSTGCFAYFGCRLVDEVGVEPGLQVLDVASGIGAVLLPAAERVGPMGTIVGVDLSEAMVRLATAATERRGLSASVRVMDAEHLDFPDLTFDRVTCGFALRFFPHLDQALAEFRRVLRPSGRIGVSTWRVTPVDDLEAVLDESQPSVGHAGPRWIDDPDELASLLIRSGFSLVRVKVESHIVRYVDMEAYWRNAFGTSIRRRLDALSPDKVAGVRTELARRLRPHQQSDGLYREASALLAVGVR